MPSSTPECHAITRKAGRSLTRHGNVARSASREAHTRGVGFTGDVPNAEIAAVIVTASARLYAHPNWFPVSEQMGAFAVGYRAGGFQGWTLVEVGVLDRYRVEPAEGIVHN
jgi:hypothetical protein